MAIKNAKRFAELERLMGDYFNTHIAPVMQSTKNELPANRLTRCATIAVRLPAY